MISNQICLCLPASICYFYCSNPWQYCKERHLAELLLGASRIGCIVPPAKSKASHQIPVLFRWRKEWHAMEKEIFRTEKGLVVARKWTRARISYDFKSTYITVFFSEVVYPGRPANPIVFCRPPPRSWKLRSDRWRGWNLNTTMRFGFLGFEFMPRICTCDVTHVTPLNGEPHVFTVFEHLNVRHETISWLKMNEFATILLDAEKTQKWKGSKDVLQRLSTTTSCRTVLNSQYFTLYRLHFTHCFYSIPSPHSLANALPSFMTRLRIAL